MILINYIHQIDLEITSKVLESPVRHYHMRISPSRVEFTMENCSFLNKRKFLTKMTLTDQKVK